MIGITSAGRLADGKDSRRLPALVPPAIFRPLLEPISEKLTSSKEVHLSPAKESIAEKKVKPLDNKIELNHIQEKPVTKKPDREKIR